MKKIFENILFISILTFSLTFLPSRSYAQSGASVSFGVFYDDLAPYGDWVSDPDYGYVWVPDAENGFRPYYTRGHWVMTEYGNTWVSDYPWGWAPFHYGRWVYNNYYGWVWIPGSEWAPAWVSWRYSDEYCGWAPLSPGISIGVYFTNYSCPSDWWVFVGPSYLYRSDFHSYWRGPRYNDDYIRRTTIVNNVYVNHYNNVHYNYGPRAADIQRVTHRSVPQYRMADASRPGATSLRQNMVSMYHPQVVSRPSGNAHIAPHSFVNAPHAVGRQQAPIGSNTGRPQFRTDLQQHHIAQQQPSVQNNRPEMQQHNAPLTQHQQPVNQQPQHFAQQHNAPPVQQHTPQQHNAPMQQQHIAQQHNAPPVQQRYQQPQQQHFTQQHNPPPVQQRYQQPPQQHFAQQHNPPPVQQQRQQQPPQQHFVQHNAPPPPVQQQPHMQQPPPMQNNMPQGGITHGGDRRR